MESMLKKKTEKEKMLSGEKYFAFNPELQSMREKTYKATLFYNTTGSKKYLTKLFGHDYEGLIINPPFYCDYGTNIKFGKNVFMNFNCTVLACAEIEIGDNCYIGPNVQLYSAIHPLNPVERNKSINLAKPIKIGKNCWLGGGVIVLPGVEIAEGTTIGAGSVVTKNIPPYCVAAGNPCRVLRFLNESEIR